MSICETAGSDPLRAGHYLAPSLALLTTLCPVSGAMRSIHPPRQQMALHIAPPLWRNEPRLLVK